MIRPLSKTPVPKNKQTQPATNNQLDESRNSNHQPETETSNQPDESRGSNHQPETTTSNQANESRGSSHQPEPEINHPSGESEFRSSNPSAKILFDEYHGELLRSQEVPDDDEVDTWNKLDAALKEEIGYEATTDTAKLTREILSKYKVLVLAAPTKSLSKDEIEAINNFVQQGGSLLIAQCYSSLDENTPSINLLLEKFGLRTRPLLTSPPREVNAEQFRPHYLSSEVNQLLINEAAYLERLNDKPHVVANLPRTGEDFLVAVEVNRGRIVAIGDFVIFGDEYIEEADNKQLALNIFRWLLCKNPLECFDDDFESKASKVSYGKSSIFSISLNNPHQKRLENINCLLESDAGALIEQPEQRIRYLPSRGKAKLRWNIEPQHFGSQRLRLIIDFPEKTGISPLFFDCAAQFQCIPEVEIDLVTLNSQQKAPEIVETGVPFEMQAVVKWANDAKQIPLQLQLKGSPEHILIKPVGEIQANRWKVIALDEGDWKIRLEVAELDKSIPHWIRAYPSLQKQIDDIQRDMVTPLTADVHHHLSLLRKELVSPVIEEIPFHLLTPEEYVEVVEETLDDREDMQKIIQASRIEVNSNIPLVEYLLDNIFPSYRIIQGCCIPYDPKLAKHLVKVVKHRPSYEEKIAYNFMSIEGNERYGKTWFKQNIVAMLIHEKYGHGFFYTHTKLGQQMAILYRHGLAPGTDSEKLRSPYPRLLYEEYESVIELIYDSSIIVNEGFATWLEITILPKISELIGQAAYRRKDFLFYRDSKMAELAQENDYFKKFQPQRASKYAEACDYLQLIQGYFGPNFGPKCAVQAIIKAADVELGISESDGQVRFALSKEQLKTALLEDESNDARSDERLRAIHDVLLKHREEIWDKQEKLQCNRSCLHGDCPVNSIIDTKI